MAATKRKSLSYPRNRVYEKHTDYITFDFYKYLAPFGASAGARGINAKADEALSVYQNRGKYDNAELDNTLARILLYMPEDIQTATGAQWGEKSFSNLL